MTLLVPYEVALLASSDPAAGSQDLTPDGSSFSVQLQEAITIPKNALGCTIEAQEAAVWFTVANIKSGINDKFYVTQESSATPPVITAYVATVDQGLYNRPQLYEAIQRDIINQGGKAACFNFLADEATQRVVLSFLIAGTIIDFTPPDTMREILGFDAGTYTQAPPLPKTIIAQNVAQFATLQFFEIHTDLTNTGIRVNNAYTQTLMQVNIDKPPGSQIIAKPFNPTLIPTPELVGSSRTNIRFWLTDQRNQLVDTNSEYWSVRVVIRYMVPV